MACLEALETRRLLSAGPKILSSSALNLSGGSYNPILNGTTAGSGYDQINVAGGVTLSGVTLSPALGFKPKIGQRFTLINNDGRDAVSGTFAGKAEGSKFKVGSATMTISYRSGTGNDVVLSVGSVSPIIAPTYVNASWAGTTPGTDPDGAGPATSFGTDSFDTIGGGVAAAPASGTVIVASGNYNENVTVTKSLTLQGAQAGVDARGRAAAESVWTYRLQRHDHRGRIRLPGRTDGSKRLHLHQRRAQQRDADP
jgi:hypothetical protein